MPAPPSVLRPFRVYEGLDADKFAPGPTSKGLGWWAIDTKIMYRSTGSVWEPIGSGQDAVRFNNANTAIPVRYLEVEATGINNRHGIHIYDNTGPAFDSDGMLIEAEQSVVIQNDEGAVKIIVFDPDEGITIDTAAGTLKLLGAGVDAGGQQIKNGADGTDPTDFATVEQLPPPAPQTREKLSGAPVTIGSPALDRLTWDTVVSGDILLDLTDPALPTVVEAGVYAVTVYVNPTSLTIGGIYLVNLILDSGGEDADTTESSAPAVAGWDTPNVSVTLTYKIPAGGVIELQVANFSGASADFSLGSAIVQRLS